MCDANSGESRGGNKSRAITTLILPASGVTVAVADTVAVIFVVGYGSDGPAFVTPSRLVAVCVTHGETSSFVLVSRC